MEQSTLDKFYLWYFLVHIPITLLVDASLVIPREYLPSISLKLIELHISTNKDFLLVQLPHVFYEGHTYGLLEAQVKQLILVYVPYFAIPFVMMVDYLNRILAIVGVREEVIAITEEIDSKKLEWAEQYLQ